MAIIKTSNITQIDQDVTEIKASLGDTEVLADMGDGSVAGAIKSMEVKALGGKKITQAEYDALEDKSGVYYITDANATDNTSFEGLTELVGDTDIDDIGDGTITGAIAEMNQVIENWGSGNNSGSNSGGNNSSNLDAAVVTMAEYEALEDKTGVYYISDANNRTNEFESKADEILTKVEILGDTDISNLADGTVTGAIADLYANGTGSSGGIAGTMITQAEYDALEDKTGLYYITDVESEAEDLLDNVATVTALTGNTDISGIGDGTITGAIAEINSVAKGATGSKVFDTFADMETWLKDSANAGSVDVGTHLYIRATDVPDYWVYNVLEAVSETTGYYYEISELETQKVNLSEYALASDLAEAQNNISFNKQTLGYTKKNLFKNAWIEDATVNGVRIDPNFDGTYTANGSSTKTTSNVYSGPMGTFIPEVGETYKFTGGCDVANFVYIYGVNGSTTATYYDEYTWTATTADPITVRVMTRVGETYDNVVIKPMIRLAENGDDTFEAYQDDVKTTIDNLTRHACVGQTESSTTNPWYKFASLSMADKYSDSYITFKVQRRYGNAITNGILTAYVRQSTLGTLQYANLVWEYANSGIVPSNFVMCYIATDTGTDIELYVKVDAGHTFYDFEVMTEGNRVINVCDWTLYQTRTIGQLAELPSDYTQVVSVLNNIINGYGFEVTGTLAAGSTSITLSDSRITTDSTIDVYTDVFGTSPTGMAVTDGGVTLSFDSRTSAINVKVRVS